MTNQQKVCTGDHPKVYWIGRDFCPLCAKSAAAFRVKEKITKEDFAGVSPSVFVGRIGYPNINVGILSPPEQVDEAWVYDAPKYWSEQEYDIPQLIDIRSALVNSRFRVNVNGYDRFLDVGQEISMASKPVDVEINLQEKPKFRLNLDPHVAPTGPNASLKNVEVTSNPKIDRKVDKVVDDSDLKAYDALTYLYGHGFDENFLSRVLSTANLGVKTDRKLVPTRWSITAVDDQIAKYLVAKVKDYSHIDYCAYFGGYLGNYYLVLFFPEIWSYELFETFISGSEPKFVTDYEGYCGRKYYAENTEGGYYAARLPILEKLASMKKQGSVLCLRFITGEYAVPLGVWVVREATRKAMGSKSITFADKELMLKYARAFIKKRFGYDLEKILVNSILLNEMKQQKKLVSFY